MNIVCIIQARMGSTRLPRKVLKLILGRPMLALMIERVSMAKKINETIIATTTNPSDEVIVDFCQKSKIKCVRGSESDVLDRYYQTAKSAAADIVVRLTADCPLIDPAVVDKIIEAFLKHYPDIDFAGNVQKPTYPDGMDTEVFTFQALERAWKETSNPLEREHVTPYFYETPGRFHTINIEAEQDYSPIRLTVDHPEDFDLVTKTFEALYRPEKAFGFKDVIAYLEQNPELAKQNAKFSRNPWYTLYKEQRGQK